MPYVDPKIVLSPRSVIQSVHILHDAGRVPASWSVALLNCRDGTQHIGFRWNGDEDSKIGNPQSHGKPTWAIVPDKIADAVREVAEGLDNDREGGLRAGYQAMAADSEREAAADEWCEGLISDAADQTR